MNYRRYLTSLKSTNYIITNKLEERINILMNYETQSRGLMNEIKKFIIEKAKCKSDSDIQIKIQSKISERRHKLLILELETSARLTQLRRRNNGKVFSI